MKRIAIIGAVLEKPRLSQHLFNDTIEHYRSLIKGRMGTPFNEEGITVVSITVAGELNEINALTGKLGNLPYVRVKTAISSAQIDKNQECSMPAATGFSAPAGV